METQYTFPATGEPDSLPVSGPEAGSPDHELRVYTLGRFTLVRDGQPLCYARKSPARPLQLLKALIALGGRQIGAVNLASTLWPDKEGDQAMRAFDTTLHRLRKYLGNDAYLLMEDGRLTLNSALVWVDAWECERQLTRLRGLISHRVNTDTIDEIGARAGRLMRYYQGHFLAREQSTCWSVSMEERLRSRFVHGMLALGHFWEQQGMYTQAIACYQKGIEVDNVIETFYQRLMLCLDRTGKLAEAMACYRQCAQILGIVLGLQPTEETRRIHDAVLSRYRQQAG